MAKPRQHHCCELLWLGAPNSSGLQGRSPGSVGYVSETWGKKDPTTIRRSGNPWNCQKRGALPWHSQPGHFCSSSNSVQPQGRVTVWNPPVPRCSQVCANAETEKAEKKTEKKTRKIFALQLNSSSNKPPTPPPTRTPTVWG